MLTLITGTSWQHNRDHILSLVARDVKHRKSGRILLVPEQISHDYERRLCAMAGPTASRYAEVLSFTRLATRVFSLEGGGAVPTMDDGGRLLAMAAAVQQLRPRLKAYAAIGAKPEFLSALVTAADEFKSCNITPQALKQASEETQGVLAQKLEELSVLLEGYNAVCSRFGMDPRDRMTKLLELLELGDFAAGHTFYIDGFTDFTAQEMDILAHLLQAAPHVTISFATDALQSDTPGLELAGQTAAHMLRLCARYGVKQELVALPDPEAQEPAGLLRSRLLSGSTRPIEGLGHRAACLRFGSIRQECRYVAARLRELALSGVRYRDLAVVLSDPERYTPVLRQTLEIYGLPAYFAGAESILPKSAVYTLVTALEALTGRLERSDILRYLKSVLSPLTPEECDRLENYAVIWNIGGSGWATPFTKHPGGLGREWRPEDRALLDSLNRSREKGLGPLLELKDALRREQTVLGQLRSLYRFLEQVNFAGALEALAKQYDEAGDSRSAQEQEQLWDILVGAMEQMAAMLGQTQLEDQVFVRLLKLLLSQYHVGTIPQTLDSITVGSVSAMRRHEAAWVFLMGAQEGCLPAGSSGGMVLTESERADLMGLGLTLQADLYRQLEQELAGIHAVAASCTRHLTLTCGSGQCAHVYRRLCQLLNQDPDALQELSPLEETGDLWEGACAWLQADAPQPPFLRETGQVLKRQAEFAPGFLSRSTVEKLYGRELRLSASQVDKLASCSFAYFMRYGLNLRERKEITVDPAEFGTFVHYILECTARDIQSRGGFHGVSLEETEELAMGHAKAYYETRFAELEDLSQRQNYLFRRNIRELKAVVQEFWAELSQSEFEPAGFEVKFGPTDQMPPVAISGSAMPASLGGLVDRLDVYKKEGKTYVRVVDYKTGQKEFDYCDVLCGLGLQMLIYLFALAEGGQNLLGVTPEPAGVLYFPARCPVQSLQVPTGDEEVEELRRKALKRQGLVLADGEILRAMDRSDDFRFLPVKLSKQELTGDLASAVQLEKLKVYVMDLLAGLVDRIASGNVEPNPYFRGRSNACQYCEYSAACHLDLWGKARVYQKVEREEFWQQIEEATHRGK